MEQNWIGGRRSLEIAQSIETAVHAGRLQPEEALPTVRDLATTLRVSPTTVAAAYKLLQARGIVTGLGRNGTRVAPLRQASIAVSRPPVPDGTIDLATGNPDPELLPPLHSALRSVDSAPRMYDAPPLLPALSTFVSSELHADGLPPSPIVLAGGGLDAIDRLLREHVRPGDRVAVEDPGFPGILDLVSAGGCTPVPVALDDEGPLPTAVDAALRARARALIVTPRAQNPCGAALTPARVRDLRAILQNYRDVLLIENDHAGPIAGVPLAPLCHESLPRWAFVRSVSKFLGPDLRLAFVAGDPLTVSRVAARLAVGTRWISRLLQQLVLALWSDPSSGRRLARAAEVYRQRREALLASLARHGIEARGRSGFNVWVPVAQETHIVQALAQGGWAVLPGERFRIRSAPGIRVTTATLTAADAERFASDLDGVVATRSGPAA